MTLSITSQNLSDYDAQLAYKTATAYLRQSDLARYLIDQLEHQHVNISVEVSSDPTLADKNTSDHGAIVWNLRSSVWPFSEVSDVTALLNRSPAQQKAYLTSQWVLMHLLALACEQLNDQLNFRDADATWAWLDEKELSASDIEKAVALELKDVPLPVEDNWSRVLT